jgi:glycosyltransferase involved in cell wall biosynthesis
MKIAYVTDYDPDDVLQWSGLGFFIRKSLLDQGVDVVSIGPLTNKLQERFLFKLYFRSKKYIIEKIFKKIYIKDHDLVFSWLQSTEAWRKIKYNKDIDAIFALGTNQVAFIPQGTPLLTYSDATHHSLFSTHNYYTGISRNTLHDANRIQSKSLKRASKSIFSSGWAAKSALEYYKGDPNRIVTIPFGANIFNEPNAEDVVASIKNRTLNRINLIFIGVEWERKGGVFVLEVLSELLQTTKYVNLKIFGCNPSIPIELKKYVSVEGFISKADIDSDRLYRSLSEAHFLIVPSNAECYGLVYAEASAYGVPSIARNVGGVSSVVRNGINGYAFDASISASTVASYIIDQTSTPDKYNELAFSARRLFESDLNWNIAGKRLVAEINEAINS